jgi:hypothetical protein
MGAKKKIGHVTREPGKMVYVDGKGDVYQMDFGKRKKKK